MRTETASEPAKPRASWQTPSFRVIAAREAQMPVGKATPGGDGISQS